ncbi:DNA mismatch repair protein [Nocardia sp. NPDC052254]|uniref:MutS-related protein n=1 Tax=Nocardia sp. NPDC052254 TaxID=3155681 RepID=UPI00341567E4
MRVDLLGPAGWGRSQVTQNGHTVADDLELSAMYDAMADGDQFIRTVVADVVPRSSTDPEVIEYRQRVVADSATHPALVRDLYAIATDAAGARRWMVGRDRSARGKLHLSLEPLSKLIGFLRLLRSTCESNSAQFTSAGFRGLADRLAATFGDEYLTEVESCLQALRFEHGFAISAVLGAGGGIAGTVLHEPPGQPRRRQSVFGNRKRHEVEISPTDESAKLFISRLVGGSLDRVADVVSDTTDAIVEFFQALRTELAFFVGCSNLFERLRNDGYALCFPTPLPRGSGASFSCRALRDPALCLSGGQPVAGNSIDGGGTLLTVVTGANSGGKSTFLRSLGAAQIMMQAGMFVVAQAYAADIRDGIFTHFRIEDDSSMTYGRLKEELVRMRELTNRITPASLVLWNEPLASTSEREAAEILAPITEALLASGVKVVVVTHLYDFASELSQRGRATDLFLRAQRRRDGSRTFQLETGPPAATSHAMDVYRHVFGPDDGPRPQS